MVAASINNIQIKRADVIVVNLLFTKPKTSSFHVVVLARTTKKYSKTRNARAVRAKLLLFLIKYGNLWRFRSRRRCCCLRSPLAQVDLDDVSAFHVNEKTFILCVQEGTELRPVIKTMTSP